MFWKSKWEVNKYKPSNDTFFLNCNVVSGYELDRPARNAPIPYGAPPAYHGPKAHGKVGPVYTFVKTDPQANFKWGVRHVAGAQYGR